MKRLESIEDQMKGVATYELQDGRRVCLDARAVSEYGAAEILRHSGLEHLLPTERVPVFQYGRRIGTMPPDFDPAFARSISLMYDLRPGDFTRTNDGWVVGRTMGASDVDCVAGFMRDPPQPLAPGQHPPDST